MAHHSPGSLCQLRVRGLNPDTVEDTLRNFLEAKTDRDVENIQYLPGRGEAIVSLSHSPDSNGLAKVHRTKVGGRFLDVSEVVRTDEQDNQPDEDMVVRVMVSGLAPATPEEDLCNYLEVLTDSDVTDVQFGPRRCSAMVTFSEDFDLKKVTRKSIRKLKGVIPQLSAPVSRNDNPAQSPLGRPIQSLSSVQPQSPAQGLAQSSVENPIQSPPQSPAQGLAQSSVENPIKRPPQSPAQGLAQSSVERPINSPPQSPAQGPAQSSVERPINSPPQSPVHGLAKSPVKSPAHSPSQTLAKGQAQSSLERPIQSSKQSPPQTFQEQHADTDLEEDFSFLSVQTEMESHSDQNSIKLTSDIRSQMKTNPSARRFYSEMFNLWGLQVDGVQQEGTLSSQPSYRSHVKRLTGDELDNMSPSSAEVMLKTEMPDLEKGVLIHSDDEAMKLYIMGDGDRAEAAVESLQMMLENKKFGLHHQKVSSQGVFVEGVTSQGRTNQDNVEEVLCQGLHQGKQIQEKPNHQTMEMSREDRLAVPTDLKLLQSPMPYSESVELADSIITALKQNSYIWNYVSEQLREINIQIVVTNKNAVKLSAKSSSALCKAKQLLPRLVMVKHVDFTLESILQFRSIEDIQTNLLNQDTLKRKVVLFNDLNILHVICTNDMLPMVDLEIETLKCSFERRTCQIPGGVDIEQAELERHIQDGSLINHRIKIKVDDQDIKLFANSDDIDQAKKRLVEYLQRKEKEMKVNAVLSDDIETIPSYREESFEDDMQEYTELPEESFSSTDVSLDERSLMRRDELLTLSEERENLLSEFEDMETLTTSFMEDLMGQELTTLTSGVQQKMANTSNPPLDTPKASPKKDNETTNQKTPKSKNLPPPKAMAKLSPLQEKKSNGSKKKFPTYQSGCASGRKISVKVYKADITKLTVDVIVSAANTMLHHGGGVSRAIALGAGPGLQKECQELVNKFGPVRITELVVTSAGQLPCKNVYHAVGPHWTEYQDKQQCLNDLCHTILRCLCRADIQGMRSIAISAISAGIFRVPLESCAKMYVRALKSFDSAMSKGNLKEVHFVDVNENVVSTIQKTLQDVWNSQPAAAEYKRDNDFIKLCLQEGHASTMDANPRPSFSDRDTVAKCPICLDTLSDPEELECQHMFCKPCIRRAVQEERRCPVSGGEAIEEEPAGGFKPDSLTTPLLDLSAVDRCSICLDVLTSPKQIKCGHTFCTSCIDQSFSRRPICPVCYTVCGEVRGVMPAGSMDVHLEHFDSLPGYEQDGTIVIKYSFNDGIQTGDHPNPGRGYKGTCQTAYLPDNAAGMKVLYLLKTAWARKLTFTVDKNTVTWNGIQHKTSTSGGPTDNGYPDPAYLIRVQQECASLGIVVDSDGKSMFP